MKLSDFSVGQRVGLIHRISSVSEKATWGIVKKIGRKYLHVAVRNQDCWLIRFDRFIQHYVPKCWLPEYFIVPDEQTAFIHCVVAKIRQFFYGGQATITFERLMDVAAALNINLEELREHEVQT